MIYPMSEKHRKAKVTEENVKESARLKSIWDAATGRPSQEVFAAKYEIGTQSALTQFLNGHTPLSLKAAMGFAKGLDCDISDFSPRLATQAGKIAENVQLDDDYVDVKQINVSVAAGNGATGEVEEVIGSLKFKAAFLRSCGVNAKQARIVDVVGHSMYPTIRDGAVLLIDLKDRELLDGHIYAMSRSVDGLIVKRAKKSGDLWFATSDNRDHDDIPMNDESDPVDIIGRAKWMGAKL